MIEVSLDYQDLRIFRKREEEIVLPDKSKRLVADKLAVELFNELGLEYDFSNSFKTFYNSKQKEIYYLSDDDFEAGIQKKGMLYLSPSWNTTHDKMTKFLKDRNIVSHSTRVDLAFTTTENLFPLIEKIDFKKMLVKTFSRSGRLQNISASHSRLDCVFYDKSAQLKTLKNEAYLKAFKEKYPQEQLYRFEIRLKGKDTLAKIPSLGADEIHLKAVALEVFEALDKRVELPNKLRKKLLEAINAIK